MSCTKMVFSALFLTLSLTFSFSANAESMLTSPQECIEHFMNRGAVSVTENVIFSGAPLSQRYEEDGSTTMWVVPHDTITVEFLGESAMIWTARMFNNPEHIGVFMDWIGTAMMHEEEYGYRILAVKGADGEVWLVSTLVWQDEELCFAHILSL